MFRHNHKGDFPKLGHIQILVRAQNIILATVVIKSKEMMTISFANNIVRLMSVDTLPDLCTSFFIVAFV